MAHFTNSTIKHGRYYQKNFKMCQNKYDILTWDKSWLLQNLIACTIIFLCVLRKQKFRTDWSIDHHALLIKHISLILDMPFYQVIFFKLSIIILTFYDFWISLFYQMYMTLNMNMKNNIHSNLTKKWAIC